MATVALAALTAGSVGLQTLERTAVPRIEPVLDPTDQPRLTFDRIVYQGAFRVPMDESNGDSFSFGGRPAAYNPDNNSLFLGAHSGRIAEISIPAPAKADAIKSLPVARYLQPFSDPTDGHMKEVAEDGTTLAGLLVRDRRLFGSGVIYYDANNTQSVSHFVRPLSLGEKAVSRFVRLGDSGKTGFVAGYMAAVPPEWQTRLGGTAITGQCCLAVISRTSWGPSAFVFEPEDVIAGRNGKVQPLVYYTGDHPTLGNWEGSNPSYGGTMELGGLALINGTRTALFVGRNGLGDFCYGNGTADQSLANTRSPDGSHYCFDPTSADKAQHAYPYRFQMWAYDLNELAEVRAGKREPWSVKPYALWPFDVPFLDPGVRIGGVAYDPARRRLFVAQMQADRDGYAVLPLIHVFTIQ